MNSMTLEEEPALAQTEVAREIRQDKKPRQGKRINVGEAERAVSTAAGAILAVLGLWRRNAPGALIAGLGGALAYRGISGHSVVYDRFGIDTATKKGILVENSF